MPATREGCWQGCRGYRQLPADRPQAPDVVPAAGLRPLVLAVRRVALAAPAPVALVAGRMAGGSATHPGLGRAGRLAGVDAWRERRGRRHDRGRVLGVDRLGLQALVAPVAPVAAAVLERHQVSQTLQSLSSHCVPSWGSVRQLTDVDVRSEDRYLYYHFSIFLSILNRLNIILSTLKFRHIAIDI